MTRRFGQMAVAVHLELADAVVDATNQTSHFNSLYQQDDDVVAKMHHYRSKNIWWEGR